VVLIRLFTFRPDRPGETADELLRASILPGLERQPRVRHYYAARANADEGDERIVVSVWDDDEGGSAADIREPFDFEKSSHALDSAVEVHRLDLALNFDSSEPPLILRVFRGRTVPGEMDNYVNAARDGTMADALAEHGPEALFLARVPPDGFVTVSAWAGWDHIAQATGGNLRQPIATRHGHLLTGGTAAFYEIVPLTGTGRAATSGVERATGDRPDDQDPSVLIVLPEMPAVASGG